MERVNAVVRNLAVMLLVAGSAFAAPPGPRDPDWPCMSIRVPNLSLGALWSGPSIEAYRKTWSSDTAVADLAATLAQRRLPMDQATAEIKRFASESGAARQTKLLSLVAALFDVLNQDRSSVVAGLDRFGARQKELANEIRQQIDKLHTLQAAPDQDTKQIATLGDQLTWETRLFEERRQTTQYACAVPDLIEQRFFALARVVQQNLGESGAG